MSLDQISSLPPADQDRILNGPALEPPPNVIPNLENPPNGNPLAYVAMSICLFVSLIAVLVRTYARFVVVRKVVVEDYLAIVALILFVAYQGVTYWSIRQAGFFVHQWDIRVKDLWILLYATYTCGNTYAAIMMIMKASILRDWSRIFVPQGVRNKFFWITHTVIVLSILFYSISIIVVNLACFPIKRLWDLTVPGPACLDTRALYVSGASINVVLDIITLGLPQGIIWRLQMSPKRKIGMSLIFAIGVFACISAIARLVYTTRLYTSADTTYATAPLSLWCQAEMTCMFLIFSGPAAPKVFIRQSSPDKRSTGPDTTWPSDRRRRSGVRRLYRKLGANDITLTTLRSTAHTHDKSASRADDNSQQLSGLIRTQDFRTSESYIEGGIRNDVFEAQHPWSTRYNIDARETTVDNIG